jgi:hypothetical protein
VLSELLNGDHSSKVINPICSLLQHSRQMGAAANVGFTPACRRDASNKESYGDISKNQKFSE